MTYSHTVPEWKRSINQNMFQYRLSATDPWILVPSAKYMPYELIEDLMDPDISQPEKEKAAARMFREVVKNTLNKGADNALRKQPSFVVQGIVADWLKSGGFDLGKSEASIDS